MKYVLAILPRWLPALLLMLVIFVLSSRPGDSLPDFLAWDYVVKKASHMIGYGLLAWSYLHYWQYDPKKYWLVWLTCMVYAVGDEFHQAFVPARSASVFDVLIFDNSGAILALWYHSIQQNRRASQPR